MRLLVGVVVVPTEPKRFGRVDPLVAALQTRKEVRSREEGEEEEEEEEEGYAAAGLPFPFEQ